MLSYPLYKVVHIAAVLFVFAALGGLVLHVLNGGSRESNRHRLLTGLSHGIGLVIVLISGFGLIARLGIGFEAWIWLKLLLWIAVGAVLALIHRLPQHAKLLWFAIPLLGAAAAYLAVYKPVW
ncbi:MAG: hypothetical protein D6696_00095 [Acidobacteria bacterium]|nr:MAG: hypothetical protein D6696_00095 [Acidobacteriota bacterium]